MRKVAVAREPSSHLATAPVHGSLNNWGALSSSFAVDDMDDIAMQPYLLPAQQAMMAFYYCIVMNQGECGMTSCQTRSD